MKSFSLLQHQDFTTRMKKIDLHTSDSLFLKNHWLSIFSPHGCTWTFFPGGSEKGDSRLFHFKSEMCPLHVPSYTLCDLGMIKTHQGHSFFLPKWNHYPLPFFFLENIWNYDLTNKIKYFYLEKINCGKITAWMWVPMGMIRKWGCRTCFLRSWDISSVGIRSGEEQDL